MIYKSQIIEEKKYRSTGIWTRGVQLTIPAQFHLGTELYIIIFTRELDNRLPQFQSIYQTGRENVNAEESLILDQNSCSTTSDTQTTTFDIWPLWNHES